jgi:superfamily II DNA helicase RecQ
MAFAFFTVPVRDSGEAEASLNGFLCSHKILTIDRRWVDDGANSFWSLCIDYLKSSSTGGSRTLGLRNKIDYKDVLKSDEFALYAKLRELRKQIAQAEAVPVYTIFTNEQLADMVRTKVTTRAALSKIEGVGDARIEKYGPRFLEVLTTAKGTAGETSGTPI